MKYARLIPTLLLLTCLYSCKETVRNGGTGSGTELATEESESKGDMTTDFSTWWAYHSDNIKLSADLTGLDVDGDTIQKGQLLEQLTTGNYIVLQVRSDDSISTYQLQALDQGADQSIVRTIKNEARTQLKYYSLEGQELPAYAFTDLQGNHYTNENTKGKILVLKTWFVNCVACVEEFPELNELVETYEDREDVLFLGLALDGKAELERFLQKKEFNYDVVPDQQAFIDAMELNIYPTHIIVDSHGKVLKVVNKASEMIQYLEAYTMPTS